MHAVSPLEVCVPRQCVLRGKRMPSTPHRRVRRFRRAILNQPRDQRVFAPTKMSGALLGPVRFAARRAASSRSARARSAAAAASPGGDVGFHRVRQEISLHAHRSALGQEFELRTALHAFRDHLEPEPMAERDDRSRDRRRSRARIHGLHEHPVQLHPGERQLLQWT